MNRGRFKLLTVVSCLALTISCTSLNSKQVSAPVPYVTTPPHIIPEMLKLANVTPEDVVYDLGSGDGRIVIAAAGQFGARGVGVEVDPNLISESRRNAEAAGVASRVRFVQADLFRADIGEATVVTVFLLPGVNVMLAPKFMSELRPGTRIVSYLHDMGEWQPDRVNRGDGSTIYCWVVPADVGGTWTLAIAAAPDVSPMTISFRQAYQQLRGSAKIRNARVNLQDPKIDGERLLFTLSATIDQKPVRLEFSGRVQGGAAAGDVVVQNGPFAGTHQWSATRESIPLR